MIVLNGERRDVAEGTTIADLLDDLDLPAAGRGVAVAVEAEVVPRSQWPIRRLADGDRVEVLAAIQGG